ncbi:hypothetical protein [Paenibacillus phytohabitans]|uniref:hypothetical protein n=1 Tax=Paenibacillus phytohabitans TaxID=2654978 RepID=UPI00300AFCAF
MEANEKMDVNKALKRREEVVKKLRTPLNIDWLTELKVKTREAIELGEQHQAKIREINELVRENTGGAQ